MDKVVGHVLYSYTKNTARIWKTSIGHHAAPSPRSAIHPTQRQLYKLEVGRTCPAAGHRAPAAIPCYARHHVCCIFICVYIHQLTHHSSGTDYAHARVAALANSLLHGAGDHYTVVRTAEDVLQLCCIHLAANALRIHIVAGVMLGNIAMQLRTPICLCRCTAKPCPTPAADPPTAAVHRALVLDCQTGS